MATCVLPPPPSPEAEAVTPEKMHLPCPVPYEEIHRKALKSLQAEDFERMLLKRMMTDGLDAGVKYNWSTISIKVYPSFQLTSDPHSRLFSFDYKGTDYRTQFQFGRGTLLGANCIQSVTPHLSCGWEVFWADQNQKYSLGCAAHFNTDKLVAAGQIAGNGMVALSYRQKMAKEVSLASVLMYNYISRDVTANFGYDCMLPGCRFKGNIDSNGCASLLIEKDLQLGLHVTVSTELKVDHKDKKYEFKCGLNFDKKRNNNKSGFELKVGE